MATSDHGAWVQTYPKGIAFYPFDPLPEEVFIEDIAHALSQTCRFAGHTRAFYSVAQHSVLVSYAVAPVLARTALMHDATEAYLQDLVRPIKALPMMAAYREAEMKLHCVISERFGLFPHLPDEVILEDVRALATEARDLLTAPPQAWDLGVEPWATRIKPWPPEEARERFIARFNLLFPEHAVAV